MSKSFRHDTPARQLLFTLLKQTRWPLAVALIACVVNGFSSVWLIATVNRALTLPRDALATLGWQFAGICVLALVARVTGAILFSRLSQGTMSSLRKTIARRVSGAPYRYIERMGAARAQTIVTDDASNVSMFFVALPNIVMHGSIVVGCLLYLAWLSWQTFLAALAVILIGSIGYRLGDSKAIGYLQRAGEEQDRLFQRFSALFSGAKELKLSTAKADTFFNESIDPSIDTVGRNRTRAFSAYALGVGWILFLVYAFLGVVVFKFSQFSFTDASTVTGYVIVFLFMLVPLDGLLNNIPTLNEARVSLGRIDKFIEELPLPEASSPVPALPQFAEVRLASVAHTYYHEKEDGFFTLGPIDLTFRPGQLIFLIGGNGSGKTTLAKLLAGLYAPESGAVTLNGIAVNDDNRATYRQLFSAVFSDFHLFESIIGITGISRDDLDARANQLVAKLHLQHKVTVRNGSFSTRDLSQGQRKRLALVAAYLEDRPFYLFDEWAADQDPVFKAVFYQELLPELKAQGKAVLVITHDDRYFHLADHCLKLESGQLVDEFTPAHEQSSMRVVA
jgi:putative ATP-binding cassette transporter